MERPGGGPESPLANTDLGAGTWVGESVSDAVARGAAYRAENTALGQACAWRVLKPQKESQ